jgi:predicted DNA binding CopG/RHH family protein
MTAKKQIPKWKTDQEADEWLQSADLTQFDLGRGVPMGKWLLQYEQYSKDKNINLRLSGGMLKDLRELGVKSGIPTQRFIRLALEDFLNRAKPPRKTPARRNPSTSARNLTANRSDVR